MSENVNIPAQKDVIRIGILLGDLGHINVVALKFLILQMNMLQRTFEYEFLLIPSNDQIIYQFIQRLSYKALVDRQDTKQAVPALVTHYQATLNDWSKRFGVKEPPVDHFILVTMARFADNFYTAYGDQLTVLALGRWEDSMAPPSMLEFILVILLRASVNFVLPTFRESMHFGTKGCLFDSTPDLRDVRYKALNGFVCNYCCTELQSNGLNELADKLVSILQKKWLGKSTHPETPAGIIAKLGADLFITTGFKPPEPTVWETFKKTIAQEWVKSLLTIIATV